ncbi:membrane-associated tyrosine- and threonine-specific cdc2-inhibitory kinase [Labeo rohita]|uniref:Sulfotransferase n=1 Tax=Labeo rohita TaxID=84645 RepID=A0A498NLR2_LABRO|nr:membrane-associated tyrosine- and threonine-specific cdc2-inhibitory kinase [Labeo rohita]
MSAPHQTSVVSTPLPLPTHFSHAQQSFSLKKRRPPFSSSSSSSLSPSRPLSHSLPPRPPSKGCPPLSRVFHHRPTPWTPLSRSLIDSPPPCSVYNPSRPQTFFDQCFTNLGLIGRGSFGEVFKVVSLVDGCQYAVKRSVQRFRGEVERARSIAEAWNHEGLHPHPYVLGFIAAWEEAGHLYIQTELCCTSLLLYAEETPFHTGETRAWTYLCDMLSALDHLHANGFAHLDIKPANIFITKSGRLKLGDFGLLIKLPTDARKQVIEGKREIKTEDVDLQEGDPRYMAPELLRGEYGTAADIFSLGVSILELACNIEVPKGGDDWQYLRMGHLPAEFTNALSEDMQYMLRLMLNPEPCKRVTAQQLLSLPSVCKRKWRRQLSLCIIESFLSLFHWCQVIYMARNAKDILVSYFYFDRMNLTQPEPGPWDGYIHKFMKGQLGWGSWYDHVKGYWKERNERNILYILYEDMKESFLYVLLFFKNPFREIKRIMHYLDLSVSEDVIERIVQLTSFQVMKDNPMANYSYIPKPVFDQSICAFMRKGEVGDWVNHFTPAQSQMFDEDYANQMKDVDIPFRFNI